MNILDIVFPKICVGCRKEGQYICTDCQRKLVVPEQICPMCGRASLDGWVHLNCRVSYGMERLIIGLSYRGMVQECLKKVKYKSAWKIIGFLYEIGKTNLGFSGGQNQDLGSSKTVITSVPMWGPKERSRGFNQAEIVAELVAKNYKVTNLVILERIKETKPMFGLKKKERRENIEGAFRLNPKSQILQFSNSRIILVDDVWTTGATMRECARVLKLAGALEVWGVALAK